VRQISHSLTQVGSITSSGSLQTFSYTTAYLNYIKFCHIHLKHLLISRIFIPTVVSQHISVFSNTLTYLLTPWRRVLLEKLTGSAASQEIPRILEPEGSSPYSQVPVTCPYPEPTPSSPHNPLLLPEDPS